MTSGFEPRDYWNALVSGELNLAKVGHWELAAYNLIAYRLRMRALRKALLPLGLPRPETRVFEAGFGVGFYLRYWASQGVRHVSGVDLSRAATARAVADFPGYSLMEGDIADLPSAGTRFDLITAIDVLYHVVDDSRWKRAVSSLAFRLADGGYLLFTDKFPRTAAESDPRFPHVRRRPLRWYEEILAEQGVKVLRVLPVFVLMDDPTVSGEHPMLGRVALLQWRVLSKAIRTMPERFGIKNAVAVSLGLAQYPAELAALNLLRRTPNLEMVLAAREVK